MLLSGGGGVAKWRLPHINSAEREAKKGKMYLFLYAWKHTQAAGNPLCLWEGKLDGQGPE